MDRARRKTDKLLNDLERRIAKVYAEDPSLRRIQKKYNAYMAEIDRLMHKEYLAYQKETNPDIKAELKEAYTKRIESLTINNKRYKSLISEITSVMAKVNQKVLDLVNDEMSEMYTINYNQVSVDCKKVGIKVNGEAEV